MSDYEREDMELAAMMGDKFIDATVPLAEMPKEKKQAANTNPTKKAAQKPFQKPTKEESEDMGSWPVKAHNWTDTLTACGKWALTFGGMNFLIFYWKQAGLMDESIAVPCMWICCALAGYGVGLNVWRWNK